MSTTDASHQEELKALEALYDKVGLRGYWDIGKTASRPAPIEPKLWRWSDIYPALQRAAQVVRPGEDPFRRPNVLKPGENGSAVTMESVGPAEGVLADPHALRGALQGRIDVAPAPEFGLDGRGTAGRSTDIPISSQANFVVQCFEPL